MVLAGCLPELTYAYEGATLSVGRYIQPCRYLIRMLSLTYPYVDKKCHRLFVTPHYTTSYLLTYLLTILLLALYIRLSFIVILFITKTNRRAFWALKATNHTNILAKPFREFLGAFLAGFFVNRCQHRCQQKNASVNCFFIKNHTTRTTKFYIIDIRK